MKLSKAQSLLKSVCKNRRKNITTRIKHNGGKNMSISVTFKPGKKGTNNEEGD